MKCECGLIADRDVVGSWNIRLRGLKIDVGSSVPPESPSMNPETGRLSATHASKVMKVAESQNGKMMPFSYENFNFFIPEKRITVAIVLDFGRG